MPDRATLISEFEAYLSTGNEHSAAATFNAILGNLLRTLYPISPSGMPEPKFLVHYTSLETLFSMLNRESPEPLRLYDTVHLNDPTEGTFFHDHLKHNCPSIYSKLPQLVLRPDPRYAYISSFIREYENEDKDEDKVRDKLEYWLAYGRNGYGCSICVPYSDFSPNLPILPVQYGNSPVEQTAKELIKFFESLPSSMQRFFEPSKPDSETLSLLNCIKSVPYFHKPKNYSYEAECRLFLSPMDDLCNPKYQLKFSSIGSPTVRHYVEHDPLKLEGVLFTGTVITLGPSIPERENVKKSIYSLLRHHRLLGPNVVCSEIPYRPSFK